MAACAEGGEARLATTMLEQMASFNLVPSPACYLEAARACAAAREWRGALALWQQVMRNDMRPAPAMWSVVLDACRAAGEAAQEEVRSPAAHTRAASQRGGPACAPASPLSSPSSVHL